MSQTIKPPENFTDIAESQISIIHILYHLVHICLTKISAELATYCLMNIVLLVLWAHFIY